MKLIPFLILIVFSITGCNKTSSDKNIRTVDNEGLSIIIDSIEVLKKELVLNGNKGMWYYKGKPFNGYSLKVYPNGALEEKWGFYNGRREGVARRWSKNEKLQLESYYKNNRLAGVYKTWWDNGVLAGETYYENGIKQGVEKKWHSNGQLFKLRNYVDGKESGFQKAWLANGKLYVNYEKKNGRIFGLRRSNLCYQLENGIVVTDARSDKTFGVSKIKK